jgi:hypothetical protein
MKMDGKIIPMIQQIGLPCNPCMMMVIETKSSFKERRAM